MARLHADPGRPLCIPVYAPTGERLLLAVPPMRRDLPREARVRILEYVIRRQIGLAETTAQIEADIIEGREQRGKRLISMISETPHSTPHSLRMAA